MISDSVPEQTPEPQPAGGQPSITPASRPRWLLPGAAAVVVLAVAIGLVAGLTLTNKRAGAASGAASYLPADIAVYYELRLDLPGDQRAALRSFLGHFSQLNVDKYLTDELDQQLDDLTAAMPSGYRYSTDVKPWFDGTLVFGLVRYPTMLPSTKVSAPDALMLAGVKDAKAAESVNDRVRADLTKAGVTITSTTHGSATIWSAKAPSGTATTGVPQQFAWTITEDELVAGTSVDLVAGALDTHAGNHPSLASRDEFNTALSHLPTDRVLTASVDLKVLFAQVQSAVASAQPSAAGVISQLGGRLPTYSVMSARFENDRFVMDSGSTMPTALPANADRALASVTPNDAIFFADGSAVGKGLADSLTYLKGALAASGGIASPQLDQVESALGGDFGSFVSWMGDTAFVAGSTSGTPYFGLISTPTDAAAARSKLRQLQSLLQLAAANGGPRVQVSEAAHDGTTITTITFEATSGVPPWASSVQYAVTDQRVVIGSGETFVTRVLDMQAGDSLAASQRFSSALGSVGGTPNASTFWLDLAGLRTALEPLIPASERASYESELKPWVAPFDYVIGASKNDGQQVEGRFGVVVK